MQKPQLNIPTFIAVQNTYDKLELALFTGQKCINIKYENKKNASKNFIPLLQQLLSEHKKKLSDISFIAVNQGPGPFTTLRTVIASVNGISFATSIPLIGIDGLLALLTEYKNNEYPDTIALLDAFNKDVYFAIQDSSKKDIETGYNNIATFLADLTQRYLPAHNFQTNIKNISEAKTFRFIGNGVSLYKELITETLPNYSYIPEFIPATCSIKQIGLMGLEKWYQNEGLTTQLSPLYLKKHPAQK